MHNVDCWLVNTGWTAGKYGVGRRMPIKVTRTLLTAALDGSLRNAKFRTDPYFGFSVPTSVPGIEPHLLYPFKTWQNKSEFDETARKLVAMFQKNFVQFENQVDADVRGRRRRCGSRRSNARSFHMAQVQSAAEAANYLHVRNDWLARRTEPILEPDLPIIDPHHHLWDRAGWRYLLDDLLADTNSGHNILATVFVQARAMLRADGPEELKPVGETEFVNGVAAMTASGIYGKIRACAGIVGHADLMLGGARRAGARGA